jgi:hypothetical protein
LFTEAQLGKDDLDCHFSFVRRCFEQFLQIPTKNMTKPAHMYDALTHPTLSITNTHVLLGNTKHDALKKKVVLPKMKVQSVHEYAYRTKTNKAQEVRVAYHGGITTPHMQHVFQTDGDMYKSWLADTNFIPAECTLLLEHRCHQDKFKKANSSTKGVKPRFSRRKMSPISEYQKTLVECASEWAMDDYQTECYNESLLFQKPSEYAETATRNLKTRGWAMKKAPPPVHIPLRVRQELLKLFNQKNPYVQPEEALAQQVVMDEFRKDVFVEYCITAARIKAFFGALLTKKKKMYKNCDTLPPDAVEGTTQEMYGQCTKKDELLYLVRLRNIQTQGALQRKTVVELVALLTEDDQEKADAANNDLDQDEAHAAVECATGALNPVERVLQSEIDELIYEELLPMCNDAEDVMSGGEEE